MKNFHTLISISLCCAIIGCNGISETDIVSISTQTGTERSKDVAFVSKDQAKLTSDAFFSSFVAQTRSGNFGDAVIQSIEKEGEILAYSVNYCSGGFALVSATKDYFPILAFSECGCIDISSIEGGLLQWLDETLTAIKSSRNHPDSIKKERRRLWKDSFTDNYSRLDYTHSRSTPTSAEMVCVERCEELINLYSDDGWNFAPLAYVRDIFDEAGQLDVYEELCYVASSNHSSETCSVVGWKSGSSSNTYGPLLETHWHQQSPYNDLCNNYPAGCGAIALAQLMKYYEFPDQITLNGYTFGWDSIPNEAYPNSNHCYLVKAIGVAVNMHYSSSGSWTTPSAFESGIESFGYTVSRQNDDFRDVEHELLHNHRPVIMLGHQNNTSYLPGSLAYIGNSHYWVVDGANKIESNVFMTCAEWQPNDCGQFTQTYYSVSNPRITSGVSSLFYHCNWGWGNEGNNPDAWYGFNENLYLYSRQNYFISKP